MTALLVVLGSIILHVNPQPPSQGVDNNAARRMIAEANSQYIKSFKEANAAGVAGVYAEGGCRFYPRGVVIRGREAIRADLDKFIQQVGPVIATLDTTEVWVVDDMIYETGKWSYTFTPQGQKEQKRGGRYVTVWKQQADGTWKIWADMGIPRN